MIQTMKVDNDPMPLGIKHGRILREFNRAYRAWLERRGVSDPEIGGYLRMAQSRDKRNAYRVSKK